jgi:Ricin-type beta-trefoil lectin domain-like
MKHRISRRTFLQTTAIVTGTGALTIGAWTWVSNTAPAFAGPAAAPPLDTIVFSNSASESAHSLTTNLSSVVNGGLGQTARIFNPTSPASTWGGTASFTLKCDPQLTNYISIKLWGSEQGSNLGRLMLFCEGKQVGYYHLGDVDPLDIPEDSPRTLSRFFYHTLPLPLSMTQGKSTIQLDVRSMGAIYGYGSTASSYFTSLTQHTRSVYRVYSHTSPYFTPASDDVQGTLPNPIPVRSSPGSEVMNAVSTYITNFVKGLLTATPSSMDLWALEALARAYNMSSTSAYHNNTALTQIVGGLDALYVSYLSDSTLINNSSQQWQGFGRVGFIMLLLGNSLNTLLSQNVSGASGTTRRTAYTKMLVDSRDYWRKNTIQYSNQMLICALGIYQCNRGLAVIAPSSALAETTIRNFIYQSVGLSPWLGPLDSNGNPTKPLGSTYYEVSKKGLTRELGYVGIYGEIIDWLCKIWEIVNGYSGVNDTTLRNQLIMIAKARAYFRYPELDNNGYRAMRMETVIGWRDGDYPGEVLYMDRASWDGHALQAAVVFQDTALIGYAQQQMADNQYYAQLQIQISDTSSRQGVTVLSIPGDYATFMAQSKSSTQLPMTDTQPDFVYSDEENGVLALKYDQERLYASLYWRARWGINNMGRIHHISPTIDRSATIMQHISSVSSGKTYTQPDWVNEDFGNGGFTPSGPTLHQAFAGTVYPIEKPPSDASTISPGAESPWSGRGTLYQCAYSRYVIAMNGSASQSFTLTVPQGSGPSTPELVSKQNQAPGSSVTLAPLTTIVWDIGLATTPPTPTPIPTPTSTYYKIVNRNSGKVLDVTANSTADGAAIEQWSDNGGTNQQWSLVAVGSSYKIVNRNSGKVLDVTANSTTNGAVIEQWSDNGGTNQQWSLTTLSGGYSSITNRNSGLVLDVSGNSMADGAAVIQWSWNGGNNQQWSLVAVS